MIDRHQPGARTPPDDLAALGAWLDEQIRALAAHPDPAVGERASALLDGVDALHRAALGRLVALLQAPGTARVWAQARQDPVIGAVLLLYDLAEPGEPGQATGTPGGETPTRLPRAIPLLPVQHGTAPPPGRRALPVLHGSASPDPRPERWLDLLDLADLPPGTLLGLRVGEVAVLLCNLAGDVFAYEDACPDTPLALSPGHLDEDEIVCPWHGCRFEARSGRRVVHRGTGLRPFPVAVEGETIRVALRAPASTPVARPASGIVDRS